MKLKYKTKRTLTQILSIVLLCAVGFGAIMGISALSKKLNEETTIIHPSFEVGGLGADGKYVDTDESIYTKDSFECQGLEVKLDFDSNVTYQAFYYDELDKFISATPVYEESLKLSVPADAIYARLVVTPIWGDDVDKDDRVCHWYNVYKYANQLEISVLKDQEVETEFVYTNISLTDTTKFTFESGVYYSASGEKVVDSQGNGYDSYTYCATEDVKFYVETTLNNAQYVIVKNDGSATRYQMSAGTFLVGEENAIELSAGEKVHISIVGDASALSFYEGKYVVVD